MTSVDQILADKTDEQLTKALLRGKEKLAILDFEEQQEPVWDGPFPPSKASENHSAAYFDEMRRLLLIGIEDVKAEQARRLEQKP